MLKSEDKGALRAIKSYLDELAYGYVSHQNIPDGNTLIFPDFRTLHNTLSRFSDLYRLVLTVLRQGHAADEAILRSALPPDVFEALVATGLLVRNARGRWRTPNLAVIPAEGLYVAVSLPPHYPVATTPKQPIYIGPESLWLIRSLPARLNGRKVLDVCAGSGIIGLVCAARGAESVVGLELNAEAVAVARFNAALNDLSDIVEVRRSDLFTALAEGETFDYVVSNPPFIPIPENLDFPIAGAGGADGTRLLSRIFSGVAPHLAEHSEGVLFCQSIGDQYSINFNREQLAVLAKEQHLFIRAYATNKYPFETFVSQTLEIMVKTACPEVTEEERSHKIEEWRKNLSRADIAAEYIYDQVIRFWKGREPGYAGLPIYNPQITDPLLRKMLKTQALA